MTQVTSTTETAEGRELRSQLRRLLERNWQDQQRREYSNGEMASAEKALSILRESMALDAMLIPEASGGLGGGLVELTIAAEELGAALIPSSLLGAAMSAHLAGLVGGAVRDQVWDEIATKGTVTAVLWPGADASWDIGQIHPVDVAGDQVTGTFTHLPDVEDAGLFLAPASKEGELGVVVLSDVIVSDAIERTPLTSPDLFRSFSDISISGAAASFTSLPNAQDVFRSTLALGAIVLAADMIGAARACLDRTVEYTQARQAFGRPIATFQALKHRIVDTLVGIEAARAIIYRAAERAAQVGDDPADKELLSLARMAKAGASDALRKAARESIQMHGGIGFTWDNPSHLYLKRWASSSRLFGQPEDLHRQILAAALAERAT